MGTVGVGQRLDLMIPGVFPTFMILCFNDFNLYWFYRYYFSFLLHIHSHGGKVLIGNTAVLGKLIFERPNEISRNFSYANVRKGKTAFQTEGNLNKDFSYTDLARLPTVFLHGSNQTHGEVCKTLAAH